MHHMLRSSMAMEIMKIVTLRNWLILQPRFADLSIYEEEYTTQWSTQFKSQSICQLLSNPFKHSNSKVLQLAKCSWIASCGLLYVKLFALYLRALGRRGLVSPSSDPSAAEHLLSVTQPSYSGILAAELTNLKFCSEINDSCTICHKDVKCLYNGFYIVEIVNRLRKRFSLEFVH